MIQISLSDLPETLQNLVNQAQMTGDNLTITKEGKPLAIIQLIPNQISANENENFLQLCEEIGRKAQARGLTEEILDELLADES